MFSFLKEHWIAYLIVLAFAVVLGYGMSVFLGAKWSTPTSTMNEHIAAEEQDSTSVWRNEGSSSID